MKHRLKTLLSSALLIGVLLTVIFASQKSLQDQGDCSLTHNQRLPAAIRRVDCSGFAYGFPLRFVNAEPRLDVNTLTESSQTPVLLGVASHVRFNAVNLLINVTAWSGLSLIILLLILRSRTPAKIVPESTDSSPNRTRS